MRLHKGSSKLALKSTTKLKGEGAFMRFRTFAIVFCALLSCASISNASLILGDHSVDASIQSPSFDLTGGPEDYTLSISGGQLSSPGSVLATLTQDGGSDDPNIWVTNGFGNDTDFAWTDYHVVVKMEHPFNLSNAGVIGLFDADGNPLPNNWTATPLTLTAAVPIGGQYVGYVDYQGGTAVPILGELDFTYKISFTGYSTTTYTQDLYPTPEPGTLVLLVCGVLGLLAVRRRFA